MQTKKHMMNAIMAYSALYGIWLLGAITSVHGAYLFLGLYGLGAGSFLEMIELVIISILVIQLSKKVLPLGVIVFLIIIGIVLTGVSCWDQSIFINDFFSRKIEGIVEQRAHIASIREKIVGIKADIASRSKPYDDLHNTVVGARNKALEKVGVPGLNLEIAVENEKIFQINLKLKKLEADHKLEIFICGNIWPGIAIVILIKLSQLSIIFIVSFPGIFDVPVKGRNDQPEQQPLIQQPLIQQPEQEQMIDPPHHVPIYEEYKEQGHIEHDDYQEQPEIKETVFEESEQAVNDHPIVNHARPTMRAIQGGLSEAQVQAQFTQGNHEPVQLDGEESLRRAVVMAVKEERNLSIGELSTAFGWSKEHTGDFLKGKVEMSQVPFDKFRKKIYGAGRKNKASFTSMVESVRRDS